MLQISIKNRTIKKISLQDAKKDNIEIVFYYTIFINGSLCHIVQNPLFLDLGQIHRSVNLVMSKCRIDYDDQVSVNMEAYLFSTLIKTHILNKYKNA